MPAFSRTAPTEDKVPLVLTAPVELILVVPPDSRLPLVVMLLPVNVSPPVADVRSPDAVIVLPVMPSELPASITPPAVTLAAEIAKVCAVLSVPLLIKPLVAVRFNARVVAIWPALPKPLLA